MKFLKAQGATEYLVLFAVVLVIVLVVVALLGFIPSIGTAGQDSANAAYWQTVRPVQINAWSIASGTGNSVLTVSNVGSEPITKIGMDICTSNTFDNTLCNGIVPATVTCNVAVGGGTSVSVAMTTKAACTIGSAYNRYIAINYTTVSSGNNVLTFRGVKPVSGTC